MSLQLARVKALKLSVLMQPQERCSRLTIDQASRLSEVEKELEAREPEKEKA